MIMSYFYCSVLMKLISIVIVSTINAVVIQGCLENDKTSGLSDISGYFSCDERSSEIYNNIDDVYRVLMVTRSIVSVVQKTCARVRRSEQVSDDLSEYKLTLSILYDILRKKIREAKLLYDSLTHLRSVSCTEHQTVLGGVLHELHKASSLVRDTQFFVNGIGPS